MVKLTWAILIHGTDILPLANELKEDENIQSSVKASKENKKSVEFVNARVQVYADTNIEAELIENAISNNGGIIKQQPNNLHKLKNIINFKSKIIKRLPVIIWSFVVAIIFNVVANYDITNMLITPLVVVGLALGATFLTAFRIEILGFFARKVDE